MRQIKISTRLTIGFCLLTAILIITSLNSINHINNLSNQAENLVNQRTPTSQASGEILNGVNHALAALRGWILLEDQKFKTNRDQAWDKEIKPALAILKQMSVNWTNPANKVHLDNITKLLQDFETEQQKIEDIAHTIDNIPSLAMLKQQGLPQAVIMATEITNMIDIELTFNANNERRALLGMMADVRGTLGLSLANIRGYLLSGDQEFIDKYQKLWTKNLRRFNDLSGQVDLLNNEQKRAFERFATARTLFKTLPQQMIDSRSSEDWNVATHWLAVKAAPLGSQIKAILTEMTENQKLLLQQLPQK